MRPRPTRHTGSRPRPAVRSLAAGSHGAFGQTASSDLRRQRALGQTFRLHRSGQDLFESLALADKFRLSPLNRRHGIVGPRRRLGEPGLSLLQSGGGCSFSLEQACGVRGFDSSALCSRCPDSIPVYTGLVPDVLFGDGTLEDLDLRGGPNGVFFGSLRRPAPASPAPPSRR